MTNNQTKTLGIDLGTKYIGIALSNTEGTFAFPHSIIRVSSIKREFDEVIHQIIEIAKKEGVRDIVIGDSKNFKGADNPIMEWVHKVKTALEASESESKSESEAGEHFRVHLIPEFMTSAEAGRHQGDIDLLDASAAAIILQTYLDKNIDKNKSSPTQSTDNI